MSRKPNAIPGGGMLPLERQKIMSKTNKLAPGGTGKNSAWIGVRTAEVEEKYSKPTASNLARCFGQDLMRGEHTVGGLTCPGKAAEFDGYRVQNGEREETQVSGTSIFDPVLCELCYKWFIPTGGSILDPFAGGSVRGIVAAELGHDYIGIDLSARQIKANRIQADTICKKKKPTWIVGDSRDIMSLLDNGTGCPKVDFVFACPPYYDLEVYSDDKRDLSVCSYDEFCVAYKYIIKSASEALKPNRFAVYVIGDVRDEKGFYRGLPQLTITAFAEAGMKLYNSAILITAVGSLPIRCGRQFSAGRKLGNTHQHVLCFFKGDPKKIKDEFPRLETE